MVISCTQLRYPMRRRVIQRQQLKFEIKQTGALSFELNDILLLLPIIEIEFLEREAETIEEVKKSKGFRIQYEGEEYK
jgi:hypothetical protein